MNIGIYVRTLQPTSPASVRFIDSILEGLKQLKVPQFHFIVFSEVIPPEFTDGPQISYVKIAQYSRAERIARRWKLLLGGIARRALRTAGAGTSTAYKRVAQWLAYEPAHFRQLREWNIRLIWNLSIDVMPAFVPFIIIIWDSNYRIHSMYPEYSYVRDAYKWHDRNNPLLDRASYVIVGTEQGKREVAEIFNVYPGKIRVIPFPTPTLRNRAQDLTSGRPAYVFYPARFWPHKNHIVLVYALKCLRERWNIALHCVLSGIDDGNLGYILRTAAMLGVRDQIEYLGNVTLEELAGLYRNATALVYCSAVGPDNFPPLEAMSVGCPVITADVPGAREQYGDAAMFFDRTNEVQLAECIKRLLDDPELRKALIQKGFKRAGQWTPLDYAKSVVKILDEFALLARSWERCDFQFN
jgi:glycosyltransferase involved in cell wall biosynthesis